MTAFPYTLDARVADQTLGLIVLQTDETIERDFHRLLPPETALHISRVPSDAQVSTDTLAEMQNHLSSAAALLPPGVRFDSLGYGCTSGTATIGPDNVARLLRQGAEAAQISTPLTAAFAALHHVGARRIAIVSPYVPSVVATLAQQFEQAGFSIANSLTFGEEREANVVRIAPASIRDAALALASDADCDALFLSCTNLRTLDVIAEIETATNLPVLASNTCLAWHMMQQSGATPTATAPGRLFGVKP